MVLGMTQAPDENDSLRAEIERLRAVLADTQASVPAGWRLTATEDKVFRVLLAVDCATRAAIAQGAGLTENRSIDVHLTRIRKKLTPFGVEIETVRSRGWRLVGRAGWCGALNSQAA